MTLMMKLNLSMNLIEEIDMIVRIEGNVVVGIEDMAMVDKIGILNEMF